MIFSDAPWNIFLEGLLVLGFIVIAACVYLIYLFVPIRKGKINPESKRLVRLQKTAINIPQRKILSLMAKNSDGMRRVEICSRLDLPMDVVAQTLSELEREGLVKQERLNGDPIFCISPQDTGLKVE